MNLPAIAPLMTLMLRIPALVMLTMICLSAGETDWQAEAQGAGAALEAVAGKALASTDSRDQAWGAHLVARHHLQTLRPIIMKCLLANEESDAKRRDALLAQFGDALLATDGPVDLAVPERFLRNQHAALALALAARDPKLHYNFLLSVFRESSISQEWLASANLLMRVGPPGTLALLDTCSLEVSLTLRDQPIPENVLNTKAWQNGRFDITAENGFISRLSAWPPLVLFKLEYFGRPGDQLVAPGKTPIYLRSEHSEKETMGLGSTTDYVIRRQDYIVNLFNSIGHRLPETQVSWDIQAKDADALIRAVAERGKPLAEAWGDFVRERVRRDMLAGDAASWRPRVILNLRDERQDTSWQIPDVQFPGLGVVTRAP